MMPQPLRVRSLLHAPHLLSPLRSQGHGDYVAVGPVVAHHCLRNRGVLTSEALT